MTETPNRSSVYYPSCAAARAAGAAPLHAGEPGYRRGLDRDGDGVAKWAQAGSTTCRPYHPGRDVEFVKHRLR